MGSLPVSSFLADFIIENGQFAVLDPNGMTSNSVEFPTRKGSSSPSESVLKAGDTLKVTFDLKKSSSGQAAKPISPHQVALLATGVDTQLNWVAPIKTRSTGKAKWELDLTRAPTDFLSLSRTGQVSLKLLIGDLTPDDDPLQLDLPSLKIPKELLLDYPYWDTNDGKAPASLEHDKYYSQPELQWTFRPPRKKENPVLSLAFVAIAISPWVLLLTTWSKLAKSSGAGFKVFHSPKPSSLLFILTLVSQEALILTYWTTLKLYQFLPLVFLLSLPLILSGRSALSELKLRRKIHPISAAHVTPSKLLGDEEREKNE